MWRTESVGKSQSGRRDQRKGREAREVEKQSAKSRAISDMGEEQV